MVKMLSYDQENDILAMHKGFRKDEKFKGNLDIGDFVLDISTKNRIVGIEIMNASEYLKDFNISKNSLKNLKNLEFMAKSSNNGVVIVLKFGFKEKELPGIITMPVQVAVA